MLPTFLQLDAQEVERFTLKGSDLAVYNLVGRATLERGSGQDLVVEVRRGGSDAARLRVETGPLEGRATLRVVYPGDEIAYSGSGAGHNSSCTLRVREDGTFGVHGDHARHARGPGREVRISAGSGGLEAWADLRILVPPGRQLELYWVWDMPPWGKWKTICASTWRRQTSPRPEPEARW